MAEPDDDGLNIHDNLGSDDTRGIVDPTSMLDVVDFHRMPAGPVLDGVVAWFWSVAWDLPEGTVHDQQVLNHPAGNVSIGTVDDDGVPLDPAVGRVYGVQVGLSHRRLVGCGWTVAARTTVGGLGVLTGGSARDCLDRQLDLSALPGLDGDGLVADVRAETENKARVTRLRHALEELVDSRPIERVEEARFVAGIADLVERDRTITQVEELARRAGVGVRTMQRLFDEHAGITPSFVIRRWRLIDAVDRAASSSAPGLADLAADLGYADQAHLSRDVRRHLGLSPSEYLRRIGRTHRPDPD